MSHEPTSTDPPIILCFTQTAGSMDAGSTTRVCVFKRSGFFLFHFSPRFFFLGERNGLLFSCTCACTLFIIVYFMYFFGIVLFVGRQGFWKTNSKVLQFLWGRVRVLGDWWKEKQMKRRNIRWLSIERLKNHGKLR